MQLHYPPLPDLWRNHLLVEDLAPGLLIRRMDEALPGKLARSCSTVPYSANGNTNRT